MFGLQWSTQVTLGDVLTSVGLLGGFLSLVFVSLQVRAGANQARIGAEQAQLAATAQRGRFLLDVINRYFDDQEMLWLYYQTDSDSFVYTPATYVGSRDAAAVSRTLYYFDTVQFLVDRKLITLEDVALLSYRIVAFFDDRGIQQALQGMYARDHGQMSLTMSSHDHALAQTLYRQLRELGSTCATSQCSAGQAWAGE